MNWELFSAFVVITIILILTPGPVVTFVIATGATRGVRAALLAVLGTTIGNAILLAAIAVGLSWILKNAAILFEILRWAGVAYLVWLGIQAWRHAGEGGGLAAPPGRVHFRRGLTVALTNPKTIAFFTAFLPQFVDPSLPAEWQLFVMCAVSILIAWVFDSGWAIASGLGRAWFMKPSRAKLLGRMSGAVLIGGGIWLSLARRPA
jgi:threonine/homoserine/homoserine lactone efflux protein